MPFSISIFCAFFAAMKNPVCNVDANALSGTILNDAVVQLQKRIMAARRSSATIW